MPYLIPAIDLWIVNVNYNMNCESKKVNILMAQCIVSYNDIISNN